MQDRGLRRIIRCRASCIGRRVVEQRITYVGLDVHKDTIAVALAEAGKRGEVREYGKIANTASALQLLVSKLTRGGHRLRFCYEARPCGYGIQRQLNTAEQEGVVVAPSLIPRKPGERIKTDRRDAVKLARSHRAGELTPVWVPDQAHEAMRDLVPSRTAAVRALRQARQQLSSFLLRHGHHYRARLGRSRTGAGSRGSNSSRPCTTSCLRISSPPLRPPRHGETAWNSTLRRRYQTGRWPLWCTPCSRCAVCDWWPRQCWWPNSAISRVSTVPVSSWPILDWCHPKPPAVASVVRVGLPRRATVRRAGY